MTPDFPAPVGTSSRGGSVDRFVKTGSGDVKQLHGFHPPRYRLRIGDWRVVFRKRDPDAIELVRVRHRREAYR